MQKFLDWVDKELLLSLVLFIITPSQWLPSEFMHYVQHFGYCRKHSWNCLFGIASRTVSNCFRISGIPRRCCHHSCDFILRNNRKSQGVNWGQRGGCESPCFWQPKFPALTFGVYQGTVMVKEPVIIVPPLFLVFSPDLLSWTLQNVLILMFISHLSQRN